jgi:hypothetical protein
MNNNLSEVERLKKLIKTQEQYLKTFETIKGNEFTLIVYRQNLDRLYDMRRRLDIYENEKEPHKGDS